MHDFFYEKKELFSGLMQSRKCLYTLKVSLIENDLAKKFQRDKSEAISP